MDNDNKYKQAKIISNPLTMIGVFTGLCEVAGTAVLPFVSNDYQKYFIWYVMGLPILLVSLFFYVLIKHPKNLYAPSDYRNDETFERLQTKNEKAIEALTEATAQRNRDIISEATSKVMNKSLYSNRILWVDDRPDNNIYERKAFEAIGFQFDLALSTQEALASFQKNNYIAIISDMRRVEGAREGYVLLREIRKINKQIPFFIYAASNLLEHKVEAQEKGAQGLTNRPDELIELVTAHVHSYNEYNEYSEDHDTAVIPS